MCFEISEAGVNLAPDYGSVVQMDRMTDSGSVGWGFESPRNHKD